MEAFAASDTISAPVLDAADFPVRMRSRRNPWAVILAGGDGVRLRPLSRLISGDDRPKNSSAQIFGDQLSFFRRLAHGSPAQLARTGCYSWSPKP